MDAPLADWVVDDDSTTHAMLQMTCVRALTGLWWGWGLMEHAEVEMRRPAFAILKPRGRP